MLSLIAVIVLFASLAAIALWARDDSLRPRPPRRDWFD